MNEGSQKKAKIILSALIVLVVILAVVIIAVAINSANTQNDDDDSGAVVDCNNIRNDDDLLECLAKDYEERDYVEYHQSYVKARENALANKNYRLYIDLFSDEMDAYSLSYRCKDAFILISNAKIDQLPIEYQSQFYDSAEGVAIECEDEEKEAEYSQKLEMIEKELGDSNKHGA